MILDSQNQFREDYIASLPHASSAEELQKIVRDSGMPEAYKTKFNTWIATYGDTVIRLSSEERSQSFTDFLEESLKRDLNERLVGDSEEMNQMRQMASRGQVLLASRDQGKTFDTLVTPENVSTFDPLQLELMTPTLRNTTNDLSEVLDEQTLLHVKKNLSDQHFLVQSARVQDHKIVLELQSSKGVPYHVEVDSRANLEKPLVYQFKNDQGESREVLETQLPEAYGESILAFSPGAEAGVLLHYADKNAQDAQNLGRLGKAAALLMGRSPLPILPPPPPPLNSPKFAPGVSMENLPNVMASKARFARQVEEQKKTRKHEEERYEKARLDAEKNRLQKAKAAQFNEKKEGISPLVKGLVSGGIVGGVTTSSLLVPTMISTVQQLMP
ncbi:MAG: hypothetical protein AAB802_02145 [Patescibacteria group bacterium]